MMTNPNIFTRDDGKIYIHTTAVGSCGRKLQYIFDGEYRLPSHFLSAKGWFGHDLVERNIAYGEEIKFGVHDILSNPLADKMQVTEDMAKAISEALEPVVKNYWDWRKHTKIPLSPDNIQGVELRLERPVDGNVVLLGTIDMITTTHIIDFKISKKTYQPSYKQQLGSYEQLAKANKLGGGRKLVNVFLGGSEWEEVHYPKHAIKSAMLTFNGSLRQTVGYIEMLQKGIRPLPCEITMLCSMCEYRHICRGY